MATPVPLPTSLPVTGCGNGTLPEVDRGELASGTVIAAIDAQPTVSVILAHEVSGLRSLGTPQSTSRSVLTDTANLGAASAEINLELALTPDDDRMPIPQQSGENTSQAVTVDSSLSLSRWGWDTPSLGYLPNEILMQILSFLDVSDLLATSRINHHFRTLSLAPILHTYRLQRARILLPPLLTSPSRPTLAELIARHIFLTHTTQISRRLARNLVAIRLSRRLPQRPSAETLVQRGVLPPECVSGCGCAPIAPALVAKRRAVEKEKLKDGLRRWVGGVWRGEVKERSEGIRKWEERAGVGRVWRLRRFWERVGQSNV
ncbi:hypothetical protein FHL15_007405 [Xylaria flabelliformis]|uniref:F-box domain-containing protein n=1 Tax=Xylaria flabelliformis TaxID=2512241 RepID=A0A553HUI6_9PEZI|nr:hypothetical protein FHL15_007405 [Xylaria flabelliformis]